MTGKKQPRRVVRATAVAAAGRQVSANRTSLRRGRSVSSLSPDEATSPGRSSAWHWRFDAQGVKTPGENESVGRRRVRRCCHHEMGIGLM
jgi:hypothetical protein